MVPGFPESEQDTSCLPAIQNYVAAFCAARRDLEVHVIAFQYPFVRRRYDWKGATVHALGGRNRRHLGRLPTWARAVRVFRAIARAAEVKALHTFWLTECTLVGQWVCRRHRARQVASIGGIDATRANPYLRRLRLNELLLTAGSAFAAEALAEHTAVDDVRVIPLGLDTAALGSIEAPQRRDIDVIGVGSLIPLKNYGAFLDVVGALVASLPELQARIVGDGPERKALEERIARQGLRGNVRLLGHLPRDEVFRQMLRSKVFVHTSQYESQGYVFLEALFAGLNLVCYDVGYTGDSDRVYRCSSLQEIIDAAAELLRHPGRLERQHVPTAEDSVRAFEPLYGV